MFVFICSACSCHSKPWRVKVYMRGVKWVFFVLVVSDMYIRSIYVLL